MNARERVMTIRLIEKVTKQPEYMKRLGIETEYVKRNNTDEKQDF